MNNKKEKLIIESYSFFVIKAPDPDTQVGSGSGQKSSGSATRIFIKLF